MRPALFHDVITPRHLDGMVGWLANLAFGLRCEVMDGDEPGRASFSSRKLDGDVGSELSMLVVSQDGRLGKTMYR